MMSRFAKRLHNEGTPVANGDSVVLKTKYLLALTGAFEDADVTHVEGDVDPIRDLEIIHEELRLKDEEYLT